MIVKASVKDVETIRKIAHDSWQVAYSEILSQEQFDYMLGKFYSREALVKCIEENKQRFVLFNLDSKPIAFASYEINYPENKQTKIHKLYVSPEGQGSGVGLKIVNKIKEIAKENNSSSLILNVNKYNKALGFYKKIGFEILKAEVIDIGHGYVMDDYVMIMDCSEV
jgi:ribosomal protein S18 acetylase RimI-like enzyme